MAIPSDLISQLVKVTNDTQPTAEETTVYGTIVESDGSAYVKLDGSELLTPITTTAVVRNGDRVTVMIKNHTAVVTGNVTAPAAQAKDIDKTLEAADKISKFEILVAYRIHTDELNSIYATIEKLKAVVANFGDVTAINAEIEKLRAEYASLDYVYAEDVEALNIQVENIQAMFGDFANISTEDLEAANAEIDNLRSYNADFTYVSADVLRALKAEVKSLTVENLEATYANIDFANIGKLAIENFFSKSGLVENVIVGDGTITGTLVGVTIKGDLIEGGTVVADKLVIRGEDGLYYKLNTDGVDVEAEQTEYNSLNGSIITAKSITATKIAVDDLVAFDATIGGFNITDDSLYSGVKESIDNSANGVFLGSDGQVAFGNAENYLKFYAIYEYYTVTYDSAAGVYTRTANTINMTVGTLVEGAFTADGYKVYSVVDSNGLETYFCRIAIDYKLDISADSILFGSTTKYSLDDVKHLTDHVKIGTHEDSETGEVLPCVELSESDSDFKMRLTNKKAVFMDGVNDSTSIDSDGIETENLRVKNDIRHYDYVWRRRSNGNLGLMWMEVDE